MKWWHVAILIVLLPVVVAIGVVAMVALAVTSVCIHVIVWTWWCLRGRDILFVYSDSPVWHDYLEENVLPHLGERVVVLNWSQRRNWRFSVARIAFHHFGGYRQFNPLAVVFRPFRRTKIFRFWKAFREYKNGQPAALKEMENDFFSLIGVQRPVPPAA